jgi:hypothetical protein
MRTSENAVNAKFAEFPFYEVGCIWQNEAPWEIQGASNSCTNSLARRSIVRPAGVALTIDVLELPLQLSILSSHLFIAFAHKCFLLPLPFCFKRVADYGTLVHARCCGPFLEKLA